MLVWQDDIGVLSLIGVSNATDEPYDPSFQRPTLDFDPTNLECYQATIEAVGDSFTAFLVDKLNTVPLGPQATWFELTDPAVANRMGLFVDQGGQGRPSLFYPGSTAPFAGAPFNDLRPHDYALVVNGPGLTAELYQDGVLVSTLPITGLQNILGSTVVHAGSIQNVASFFDGRWGLLSFAPGVVATAPQVAAMHAWAQVEFEIGRAHV